MTNDHLRMQKMLGWFYLKQFFKLLGEQKKSGQFLKIGPGSGYQTAEVAGKYREVAIVAVEPSADMIAVATDYLTQNNVNNQVQFVIGSVKEEKLIHGLGEFDLIYSTFSLHHWTNPVHAFRNQ